MADGIEQTHVFGALHRQLADCVVMYHVRNAAERLAELTQNVLDRPGFRRLRDDLHVHEPATASATTQKCYLTYLFICLILKKTKQMYMANSAFHPSGVSN